MNDSQNINDDVDSPSKLNNSNKINVKEGTLIIEVIDTGIGID